MQCLANNQPGLKWPYVLNSMHVGRICHKVHPQSLLKNPVNFGINCPPSRPDAIALVLDPRQSLCCFLAGCKKEFPQHHPRRLVHFKSLGHLFRLMLVVFGQLGALHNCTFPRSSHYSFPLTTPPPRFSQPEQGKGKGAIWSKTGVTSSGNHQRRLQ